MVENGLRSGLRSFQNFSILETGKSNSCNIVLRPKKVFLFPEMRLTGKIFTRAAANLFFNRFSGDILFFSIVSFAFLYSCFFLCFLCLFIYLFEIRNIYLIYIWSCGRVSDKNISLGRFPETKRFFYGLSSTRINFRKLAFKIVHDKKYKNFSIEKLKENLISKLSNNLISINVDESTLYSYLEEKD